MLIFLVVNFLRQIENTNMGTHFQWHNQDWTRHLELLTDFGRANYCYTKIHGANPLLVTKR